MVCLGLIFFMVLGMLQVINLLSGDYLVKKGILHK